MIFSFFSLLLLLFLLLLLLLFFSFFFLFSSFFSFALTWLLFFIWRREKQTLESINLVTWFNFVTMTITLTLLSSDWFNSCTNTSNEFNDQLQLALGFDCVCPDPSAGYFHRLQTGTQRYISENRMKKHKENRDNIPQILNQEKNKREGEREIKDRFRTRRY